MLKKLLVNGKGIPLPVPLTNLREAMEWAYSTLVRDGCVVTKVMLNRQELCDERAWMSAASRLDSQSLLELRIESPLDLFIQTLDSIRNLVVVMSRGIKVLAVNCWQCAPSCRPPALDQFRDDLKMLAELLDSAQGLVELEAKLAAAYLAASQKVEQASKAIAVAMTNSDWRGVAKLLLNQLEKPLEDLMGTIDSIGAECSRASQKGPGRAISWARSSC